MKRSDFKIIIIALLFGLVFGAITYWFQPYSELKILTSNIPYFWSFGAFFGSMLLQFYFKEKPKKIAFLVSVGVILAVIVRIVYDTLFWDKTSHNLAPFEIILCGAITFPSAFIGAYSAFL